MFPLNRVQFPSGFLLTKNVGLNLVQFGAYLAVADRPRHHQRRRTSEGFLSTHYIALPLCFSRWTAVIRPLGGWFAIRSFVIFRDPRDVVVSEYRMRTEVFHKASAVGRFSSLEKFIRFKFEVSRLFSIHGEGLREGTRPLAADKHLPMPTNSVSFETLYFSLPRITKQAGQERSNC